MVMIDSGCATILVVDDSPANLEVIYNALAAHDYLVRVEMDGQNAIEQAQSYPPDLLLLDIMLPGLDGFEVCRQLKANSQTCDIPIIFMTSLTETTDKIKGFNLGAVDYITKPFHQEEVLARVRLHLELQHLTKTLAVQNQDLKQWTETLEDKVAERTSELSNSLAKLEATQLELESANAQLLDYTSSLEKRVEERTQQLQKEAQERQKALQSLESLNQELEQRVEQRTYDLRQNQAYLRLLERAISASNNGIVIVDTRQAGHPVIFVNPAFEAITGYSEEEVIGRNCRFLQGEESEQPGLTILRDSIQNQVGCTVNLKNYRKDGSLFWNELSISPIRDSQGELSHYIGIQTDVSERLSVEQRLWSTNLRLETLLQSLQSGILVEDETREIVIANRTFCRLFNIELPPDELTGRNCQEISEKSKLEFHDPQRFVDRVQELLVAKKVVIGEEIVLADQRILERDYIPILADGHYRGHLWQYRDISERKQSESQVKASLLEKEILLKEIHHRVKNNLLVVSSLLEWQTDYSQDPSWIKMIGESQNRIYAMALIHEKLYQSKSLAKIDLSEYLETLIHQLTISCNLGGEQVQVSSELDSIFLNIETVTPCGLIINELISNVFEHAFPEGRSGNLFIGARQDETNIVITIKDDGIGLPHDFELAAAESMGFQLVALLTKQLEGELRFGQSNGTEIQLVFAELRYKQRV